ncbi:MAG TPA: hypothetical protein VGU64_05895 [Terriglobales bacterium]|nr:hypothetical protein [Terriglobales bacterium]
MNPRRVALWFLIVSVALSAIIGIIVILSGEFGRTQAQILLTTLTISGASILALACGALWETGRAKLFPLTGIALAIADACLFIVGIWFETGSLAYWRFSASVGLIAIATAHACLISLARLAPRFAWSRIAAFVAAYSLALLFIYIIYFTPKGDALIRVIGVTSIVLAALTILTPVFHRLSRGDLGAASSAIERSREMAATITCPRCGAQLANSLADTKCDRCGCRFVITILDESKATPQQTIS